MSRDTITVELPVLLPNSARLVGKSKVAHQALEAIDSLRMWEHSSRSWLFPRTRVDDLVSHLSNGRREIYVIEVER
jgi:hypothetical protein